MQLIGKMKYAIIKSAVFALSATMLVMSTPISVNAKETQYADGTFEGSGKGHVDTIVLDVTIANGKIVDIETKQQNETPEYWEMAVPDMYNNIINKGDTDVDTISGATDSSNGIKDAVNQALEISASKATEDKNKIFESGNGTQDDPYIIHTTDQLQKFAKSVTADNDYSGKYIVLDSDVNISDISWEPIGGNDCAFNGDFNGQNHSIIGMKIGTYNNPYMITEKNTYVGFFGILNKDAQIKNLKITGIDIESEGTNGNGIIGSIAGGMKGFDDTGNLHGAVIDNCYVSGSIYHESDNGDNYVGGIVGWQKKGAVINCKSDIVVSCYVSDQDKIAAAAGIAGVLEQGLIANSLSIESVGGGTYENNSVTPIISNLVAINKGTVSSCYASGSLSTHNESKYGGMISGWITETGKAYDSKYDKETGMSIGGESINPPEPVGTQDAASLSDDGFTYVGGLSNNLEGFDFSGLKKTADDLNASFENYPVDITRYGVNVNSLKKWYVGTNSYYADLGSAKATIVYKQPVCELVPESALQYKKVIEQIDAIGDVTIEKENAIKEARMGYDALSEDQKNKVSNYELLTQAETKLSELKKEEENSKTDKNAAAEVEKKIDTIGTVTKDSGDIIKEARTAYDALTATQKALVSNVNVLTTAEEAYKKLNRSEDTPTTKPAPSIYGDDKLTGTDKSLSNTKNTSPKTAEEKSLKGTSKTVKTGDTTKMFLPICGIIFTAGVIVVVIRRKRISKR